ncbi:MAG: Penicillin-binding protein 2 [Candidatus Woesebacteria bacterium GW2011_GWA1_39_8]|jgi:penicillin-binding protein 2|uniref:Penicillin-binding protein 2 n=1 Tax=Candidatus Woesebacteria bacterium GW2011_GWA1_39_8 TaxID=1618552 RepID=A0A0G0PIZ8_9BACT|nr:MAG: Penicillin-binding protein 2 [Candidatus Woesebacteria bacterium GW2011_GWA1_39_8]
MESLTSARTQSWLSWFLRGLLIFGLLILLARLVDLQVVSGKYYRELANENRVRRITIPAARGKILARGGEILVGNREVKKRLVFDPKEGYSLEGVSNDSNSMGIVVEWLRNYPLGEAFAHVGGYVGEVSQDEVGKVKARCADKGPRTLGSLIGRTGLEEQYDCILTGVDGEELVEVDAMGRLVRILGVKEPIAGQDLKTNIDFGLQKKVATLLYGKKGVIIVTDSENEVLALFSSPSYDPNAFVNKSDAQKITRILTDIDQPLFNRAISGTFHPGSVFKPFVAVAALEDQVIDENYTYDDPGVITVNNFSYSNWYFTQYGGKEGKINLERAIARSTDTFFYKIGELIGVESLDKWAHIFGLDEKTNVDLPGEIAGLIPSPEWKLRVKGERWFLGNTYHMSIGQGDVAITPIEENTAISAIASGGNLCEPRLFGNGNCTKLPIADNTIGEVKNGMIGACSFGGTGFTFFDFADTSPDHTQVACKTGTAETTKDTNAHAWFVSFAPVETPEIISTVLVEQGGEGSKIAGPIAREIFNYWFKVPSVTPTPTPAND